MGRVQRRGRAGLHRRLRDRARTTPQSASWRRRVPVEVDETGLRRGTSEDAEDDVSGHGTACASVIRALAPRLRADQHAGHDRGAQGLRGTGMDLLAGLAWAVERALRRDQPEPVDQAAQVRDGPARTWPTTPTSPARCSSPRPTTCRSESYPWRFAALVSVGSHEGADPTQFFWNPEPPVEVLRARGGRRRRLVAAARASRRAATASPTPHIAGDPGADPRQASAD